MNKRQAKKQLKKLQMWCGLDSIPCRCFSCEFYDSGDFSVGEREGCEAPYLYDAEGDFIEKLNDKAVEYLDRLGWGCPHFRLKEGKEAPKALPCYKEIKKAVRVEREYYKRLAEYEEEYYGKLK